MITELRVNKLAGLALNWEATEEEATDSDDMEEEAPSFDELLLLNMDKKVDWMGSNANTQWSVLIRWSTDWL